MSSLSPNKFARRDTGDTIRYTSLTPREHEVMEVLVNGLGSKFAARELRISYETIRTHQRNIYRKLGARTLCNALNLYRTRYPME